ncbi:GNAT family N-acetyltransferase [Jatrophihabitans telluris]
MSLIEAYPILKLRIDVFVVEQDCAYPDLDDRDLEETARWVWATDDTRLAALPEQGHPAPADHPVIATLRILLDPDGRARIGRVATAESARSNGTARRLMDHALELIGPGRVVVLEAQAYLQGWYERFGFEVSGNPYIEDGIPHVPMTRAVPLD